VADALVNQECLVVLHSGGMVRLYSLQHILAEVAASMSMSIMNLYSAES